MSLMDQLERKYGRFTFPYLLQVLLAGQVLVYFATVSGRVKPDQLMLNGMRIREIGGAEWIRAFTYLVTPMNNDALWFAIGLYVTWLIGSSLERQWGEFRFGLYLGTGWLATIVAVLLFPTVAGTNVFIMGSLTLAFARLFPNVEFLLFFVIPVKVKFIGYVMWGIYGLTLITGPLPIKAQVLAGILPFLLFFGREMVTEMQGRKRTREFKREASVREAEPFHTCSRCGRTDRDHPELDFRYLPGDECVCEACLTQGDVA